MTVKVSKYLVYGLIDPISKELRYIGRSCKGLRRARASSKERVAHKGRWISKLEKHGFKPSIVIIEECCTMEDVIESEIFWIEYYQYIGANLTNLTKGGNDQTPFPTGQKNPIHDPEVKKKIKDKIGVFTDKKREEFSKRGIDSWKDSEYRKKCTDAIVERCNDIDYIQKISTSAKARQASNPTPGRSIIATKNGKKISFRSIHQAATILHLQVSNIHKVLTGQRNHSGGYKFIYD